MGELLWWSHIFWKRNKHTVFWSSIVRNHEVSLQRFDSNSFLSFAGLVSFFPVPSAEVDSKRKKKVQQECVSLIAQQPDSQTSEVVRAPFRFPTPDVWESGYTTNQHKIVWFKKKKNQVRETTAVPSIFLPPVTPSRLWRLCSQAEESQRGKRVKERNA